MRLISEITRPDCKISIMSWNQKYIVKIEAGQCEQIFKVPQLDVDSEENLKSLINDEFISRAVERFSEMHQDLQRLVD